MAHTDYPIRNDDLSDQGEFDFRPGGWMALKYALEKARIDRLVQTGDWDSSVWNKPDAFKVMSPTMPTLMGIDMGTATVTSARSVGDLARDVVDGLKDLPREPTPPAAHTSLLKTAPKKVVTPEEQALHRAIGFDGANRPPIHNDYANSRYRPYIED